MTTYTGKREGETQVTSGQACIYTQVSIKRFLKRNLELARGVTGKAIAAAIQAARAKCHLDSTKIRGQACKCAAVLQKRHPLGV